MRDFSASAALGPSGVVSREFVEFVLVAGLSYACYYYGGAGRRQVGRRDGDCDLPGGRVALGIARWLVLLAP
jgi:hypothetical protein